jgi:hypothetical protein
MHQILYAVGIERGSGCIIPVNISNSNLVTIAKVNASIAHRYATVYGGSSVIRPQNFSCLCIHCIYGSSLIRGSSKKDTIGYRNRARGGSIIWIGRGPEDIAIASFHCHPSTSNCGVLGWFKSEVFVLTVGNVGVDPPFICCCTPHTSST